MRNVVLLLWLLLPAAAGAYHYGPGQDRLRTDEASAAYERALAAASEARALSDDSEADAARACWTEAEAAFTEALEALPSERIAEGRALRLERAKARMFISQLPDARRDLGVLLEELVADSEADPKVLADTRSALANAQYYSTWLMRLEGLPRAEWEPEIEASRQHYKLLAESAMDSGDGRAAEEARENLESSIRLARMDLQELQGLPLPSQ